jgi:hypothetical protein
LFVFEQEFHEGRFPRTRFALYPEDVVGSFQPCLELRCMSAELRFNLIALLLRIALSVPRWTLKVANMEPRSLIKQPVKCARVALQRSMMVAFHSGEMQTF